MPSFSSSRSVRSLFVAVAVTVSVSAASSAEAGSRDILWDIVTSCLDPQAADYCENCQWPRSDSACAEEEFCKETTEVWAENAQFVAIRDRKMCGCPKDFVHGLAVPRSRVTGVEDPNRPDGIWSFAWTAARYKIGDENAAALAVNPAGKRAQDQLHVHILRLRSGAREKMPQAHATGIEDLSQVWKAAAKLAEAAGYKDYGVLVTKRPQGGFQVLVDQASPEKTYAIERCR